MALGAVALLYPLLALFALKRFDAIWVAGALGLLVIVRLVFGKGGPLALTLAALCAVGAMALTTAYDAELAVRLYPVFMGTAMFTIFAHSLYSPPSMIERFARIAEPDLPPEGVVYTRKVTIAWCVFLLLNLSVALYTAIYTSLEVWALYNGVVAYVLMGVMFAGEFVIRRRVRRDDETGGAGE